MSDDLPPHDLDAERAVLGCILIAPETIHELRPVLSAGDFHEPAHREIYSAMLGLDGGREPDFVNLWSFLQERGKGEVAGGEGYLAKLVELAPMYMRAPQYAATVRAHAQRRRLLSVAAKLAEEAYHGDPAQAAGRAHEALATLAPAAPAWPWRGLDQALQPKPERSYVLPGVLPVPSLAVLYGTPGALKTMLAMDLAICVAGGDLWLEGLPGSPEQVSPFAVIRQPVLWLDCDNGLDRTERRLAALSRGHRVEASSPLAYLSFPSPPFVASEPAAVQALLGAVATAQAGLVVIDNLAAVSGGADENSADMLAVMAGLRQVAEAGHCAVLVIHHKSKGDRTRAGDSLRGHSCIEGALDLALLVAREEEGDSLTLRSTKTRDTPVSPFTALWTYEQDYGGELASGRFYGLGKPEAEALSKQEQAELCIETDLPAGGMNQTEIVRLVKTNAGLGRNATLAALRAMMGRRQLETRPGEHGAVIYLRRGQ